MLKYNEPIKLFVEEPMFTEAELVPEPSLQGYFAHKKTPPPP